MRITGFLCVWLICIGSLVWAQDEDDSGGFLVDLLEKNLSGENRSIKVRGLEGALSGAATIAEITVSDNAGVWLTVKDAILDWNRLALVRGRFSVNTLSAGEIILARKPTPTDAPAELPDAEAAPFQLPELPVAIEIAELRVDRFELGEPVIGRAAELSLNGKLSLADGSLDTGLDVQRLDKQTDKLKLLAGFANETSVISLDLELSEDPGGLVSELLSIPDDPAILLTARGEGPVTDFTADISLASDQVERLGGQVRLSSVPTPGTEDAVGESIQFEADLGGDVTPLLAADFQSFFGDETSLQLLGRSDPDGRIAVDNFDLRSNALDLRGAVQIAGGGIVEEVLLDGRIVPPDGEDVVLPTGAPRTAISEAVIAARFDSDQGNSWTLRLSVNDLDRPDLQLAKAEISADGTLDQQDGMKLAGTLAGVLRGIGLQDPNLMAAIGSQIRLDGSFETLDEKAVRLSDFVLRGSDFAATVDAEIDGLESGFQVDGTASVQAEDLSRFSGLAGRDLTGAVSASVTGSGAPLGGSFDFDLTATAQDPTIGIEQVDALISGRTDLSLQAVRDETGLEIKAFELDGTALSAEAKGAVRSDSINLDFNARLDDLARAVPEVSGPVTLSGDVTQDDSGMVGKLRADGPTGSVIRVDGTMATDGAADVSYTALIERIERFLPQLPGTLDAKGTATRAGDVWQIETTASGPAGIAADISGSVNQESLEMDGSASVRAADLSPFSALAGRDLAGAVSATITGKGVPQGGVFDFDLTATAQDPKVGIAQVDDLITGRTDLVLKAARDDSGLDIETFTLNGTALTADAKGTVKPDDTNLDFNARLDDLGRVVPQVSGPLTLTGDVAQQADGIVGKVRANGPTGSVVNVDGTVSPDGVVDVTYEAILEKVERFLPQLAGVIRAQGRAGLRDDTWTVSSDLKGPTGSVATLSGSMAPDGAIDATYDATLTRIERFVPDFPGTVSAKGTASRKDETWQIDMAAEGPASIKAAVAGTVDQSSLEADVTAKGQVQIAAANEFIKPNSVQGLAQFDLALKGPAGLDSLSGKITLPNGSVAIPDIRQTINDLDAEITLANGRATIATTAGFSAGGEVRVSGPVTLAPPFDAAIVIDIVQLILTDNVAIDSSANGRLTFNGALTGNAALSGQIQFGETNINIATMAGSVGAAPIPPMTHSGETGAQYSTRDWAGLIEDESGGGGGSSSNITLDILLVAAEKVFVRGRGLQAELGGSVQVRGTTAQIAPAGQIELIRGTMAILGRRLKLTKGLVALQGDLEPYMEFEATTSTSEGDATLEIAGPVTAPKVTVYSDPVRPSEEALAMLVFGNQFSQLSPFKIAQLAASLAQLSGAGGGATESVREDLGVDTLDIGTDDDGNAEVGAGKYIAEGVYTDVSVNALGDTELNINLDVTDNFTVKGSVDNSGETSLGIFFERDY